MLLGFSFSRVSLLPTELLKSINESINTFYNFAVFDLTETDSKNTF